MPLKSSSTHLFLRQFRRQFHATGALLPSGRSLSWALAKHVRQRPAGDHAPRRIVEVGPGTGVATARIVDAMGPNDTLDLFEINREFVDHLNRLFQSEPSFRHVADRTRVFCQPIEELDETESCDVIVSGLPLNNFSVFNVERILALFSRMLKPGGYCSFFEYIAIRRLKALLVGRNERQRLRGVGNAMNRFLEHEDHRQSIWLNVPPAYAHHVRKPLKVDQATSNPAATAR